MSDMHETAILKKLNDLSRKSMTADPSDTKELAALQTYLDNFSVKLRQHKKYDDHEHALLDIQAWLHYARGNYDDAERFINEAVRLVGEYPDAKLLKRLISNERANRWTLSSNESTIEHLKKEKSNVQLYLALAVIGLFIFIPLFINANGSSSKKSEVIDTCISEINDASDTIGTLNDTLDTISYDASNASGSDYDEQESVLDDISSKASDAKQDAPTTDCAQPVSDDYSSSE